MTDLPPTHVIEEARRRNNVHPSWLYAMCANACGELVFYPPVKAEVMIVCSVRCAKQYTDKIQPK